MTQPPAAEFARAAAEIVDDLLRDRPEWATWLGDHRFDHLLDDRSDSAAARRRGALAAHRARLAALDLSALPPEDRVDAQMLAGELDREMFEIDEIRSIEWNPLVYNVGEALYPLLTRDVLPVADRLRAVAARLELLPDLLLLARRQLTEPPRVHVETALQQHPGTVMLVRDQVGELVEQQPEMRRLVEPVQQRALGALEEYERLLRTLLDGPHRDHRLGADRFARALPLTLQSPLTAAEILSRAREQLEAVTTELAVAAGQFLGDRRGEVAETIATALDAVAADRPDDRTIVDQARHALSECAATVRRTGLVSVPEDPVRVEVMPAFRRGVAVAYCDPAGPLEEGGSTSYAISPTPDGWPAERITSFYREYNSAMLVNLTVHEAMPGHVVQLAHSRRFRGSSLVRTVLWSGPFTEGWAVHAERLMAEVGHGGLSVRLQQLKMQLRMTLNAILDAEIHAGSMTEAQAIELMTRRGFQEEGEAIGKWRRACLTSAQLSTYFVGYLELADLFAGLAPIQNYDDVLAHGSPPPSLLGSLVN